MSKILGIIALTLILVIGGKFLIKKSDEQIPTFSVLIVTSDIKVGDLITESVIEPMVVPGSAVKNQAFFWSFGEANESEKTEMTRIQLKKILGRAATKEFFRGDQITVSGIK